MVFLILFFIIWLLSYLLTRMRPGFVEWSQTLVAREVAFCLKNLGYKYAIKESTLTFYTAFGGWRFEIIPECTALYTSIIYFSIIGAYPARIGEKLIGVLVGIPAIHALNLARMLFVSILMYHRPRLFELFHGYLWQVGFVIFMLLIVIVWMWKVVKTGRPERNP
ncbi:MAG: archaeosortase/exosortase family protein [Candidatus Krumholzibacteria bacterium]|nr:archaeosortase/exosortase family protein [Candidatus Krumholzibacteria bacterium]